jgi:hypothetical protein
MTRAKELNHGVTAVEDLVGWDGIGDVDWSGGIAPAYDCDLVEEAISTTKVSLGQFGEDLTLKASSVQLDHEIAGNGELGTPLPRPLPALEEWVNQRRDAPLQRPDKGWRPSS